MDESTVVLRLQIRGTVQGVGYRWAMAQAARRLGVAGWVRNRRDGSVEAVFAGPAADVTQMIADCRRGPTLARVDGIEDQPETMDALGLRPSGTRFAFLPTL